MRIYDISLPLSASLPVWPGDPRVCVTRTKSFEAGDGVNCSHLSCNVHSGTHVDAPFHSLPHGSTVEEMPLELMIGPAYVGLVPDAKAILPSDLERLNLPHDIQRLLLRTCNSLEWAGGRTEFTPDFAALTPAAAKWMVERGIRLLAVDYLSVQRFSDRTPATHVTLLEAGVVIVEGVDLHQVPEGSYQLVCLPLRLKAAEGAPARAVLIKE